MAWITPSITGYSDFNQTGNVSDSKSGWHSWKTTVAQAVNGYISKWDAMAYRFTVTGLTGNYRNTVTKLKITLHHIKTGKGTFNFYISSSDPTNAGLSTFKKNNKAWGSASYNISSNAKFTTTTYEVDCNNTLSNNITYYLVVSSENEYHFPEISKNNFAFTFEYTGIDSVSQGTGTTTITDNYNNNFTLSASAGSGNNNPTTLKDLRWSFDSATYNETFINGETKYNNPLGKHNYKNKSTRPVYAKSVTDPKYGDDILATAAINLIQFYTPTDPYNVNLTYTKNRLTIKEPWKFSWKESTTPNSTTSPIKGYRITLYKNNVVLTGLSYDSTNKKIIPAENIESYIDTGSTSTEVTINPVDFGYLPTDTVYITVQGYTQWSYRGDGKTEDTENGIWEYSAAVGLSKANGVTFSGNLTVQNAGIVRVKVGNTGIDTNDYKEGQVWVKISNTGNDANDWKEADIVKVKVSDTGNTTTDWQESE